MKKNIVLIMLGIGIALSSSKLLAYKHGFFNFGKQSAKVRVATTLLGANKNATVPPAHLEERSRTFYNPQGLLVTEKYKVIIPGKKIINFKGIQRGACPKYVKINGKKKNVAYGAYSCASSRCAFGNGEIVCESSPPKGIKRWSKLKNNKKLTHGEWQQEAGIEKLEI